MYKEKGFTFIELLVVLSVMGIVLGIGIAILSSTLRSSTKTTLTNSVKQSGDFATEMMVRSVRNAVDVCVSGTNEILIYNSKVATCPSSFASIERLRCVAGSATDNGRIERVDVINSITTNITNNVKVKEGSCNFSASNSIPKRVTINFTLKQDYQIQDSADTKVEIPFRTEVTLRNF